MDKLRVVQWTTGKIGTLALRGIFDDPRLELVGVYAYSRAKAGQDAGIVAGRTACGITLTCDVDALIGLAPDTVIYTPYEADLGHIVRLLESGADVISTNLLSNLGGLEGAVRAAIAGACERGGSSFFITGINPGWLDNLGPMLTPICSRVRSVSITESVSVGHYQSEDTWLGVGMALAEATPEVVASARSRLTSFRDSVTRIAEALEFELDAIDFSIEYATAREDVDLGWWRIPAGTHAALRSGWHGKIGGRTVVSSQVVWYMTKDKLVEAWDIDADNYIVAVDGDPGIKARIAITIPAEWRNIDHATVTAMPAVSAAVPVRAAPAGILGLKGAGFPCAPAGLWPD